MIHAHPTQEALYELMVRLESVHEGPTPLPAALAEKLGDALATLVATAACRKCANDLTQLRRDFRGINAHEEISSHRGMTYVIELLQAGCTHLRIVGNTGRPLMLLRVQGDILKIALVDWNRNLDEPTYTLGNIPLEEFAQEPNRGMKILQMTHDMFARREGTLDTRFTASLKDFLGWDGKMPGAQ